MDIWVAVDKDGEITIYDSKPYRDNKLGIWESDNNCFIPKNKDALMLEFFKMSWGSEPLKMDISNFNHLYNDLMQ